MSAENKPNQAGAMTDEEVVRQVYPDAKCFGGIDGGTAIFSQRQGLASSTGYIGSTPKPFDCAAAWADARAKLVKPSAPPTEREICQCGKPLMPREHVMEEDDWNCRNRVPAESPTTPRLQVTPEIYGNPVYLTGLLKRIKSAYFDREWKAVERLFEAEIEEMEKRVPKPEPVADRKSKERV